MRRKLTIAVLGMGVGGLAVATKLARRGHRVTIYDGMTKPGPVGSGFVLQPTGLTVLEQIGVLQAVKARGTPITRMKGIVMPSGKVVLDISYPYERYGLAIQRQALFNALYAAAQMAGTRIVLGHKVEWIDGEDHPTPVFANASRIDARNDLVIDAMGARGPHEERSRRIGYGAIWATVPWDDALPFATDVLEQRYERAHRMVGILPVGTATSGAQPMATVFWSIKDGAHHTTWREDAARLWPEAESMFKHARGLHAEYRHHTHRPRPQRRVIRIGDAWHATSPQLGQGANMALLDALSLDYALDRSDDVDAAITSHIRQRRGHIHRYQMLSRLMTPFYQSDGALRPLLRDLVMSSILARFTPARTMVARMVAGEWGDPIARIISRYEREVLEIAG